MERLYSCANSSYFILDWNLKKKKNPNSLSAFQYFSRKNIFWLCKCSQSQVYLKSGNKTVLKRSSNVVVLSSVSATIMESLQVIEKADPRTLQVSGQDRILKISYDVFLPNVPLKKSLITRPNYRLCIMG